MRTSAAGLALIKSCEGRYLNAYLCPAGVWTIGYGHTSAVGPPPVAAGDAVSQAEADQILRADLRAVEDQVQDAVLVDLTQGQFDALVSFTFNLGIGAFKSSTLLKRVNEGNFDAVPGELMKWTKARANGQLVDLPGLVKRRRAEAKMWRGLDDHAETDPQESRATPETPQPSKTMAQSKEGNGAIVAGGAAGAGAAADIVDKASQASGVLHGVLKAMESPKFWVLVIAVVAAGAVWYWRRRRLQEEGA